MKEKKKKIRLEYKRKIFGILYMVKYYLSLCLFVKNERYLEEFICYYKILGVEHFYIYDNQSTIPVRNRLEDPFYSNYITFVDFCGEYQQLNAYNHCLKNFGHETRWLIVVDGDEYIVPKSCWTIREFMNNYEDVDALGINWRMFGTNYYDKRPRGFVIENYIKCSKNQHEEFKCIVKPSRCYEFVSVHHPKVYDPRLFLDANRNVLNNGFRNNHYNIDKIQINHYRFKSLEDAFEKSERGYGDPQNQGAIPEYNIDLHNNDNDDEDLIARDRYLPHIKSFNMPIKYYNDNEYKDKAMKYVLCRPEGGLNDMFVQISKCYDYCIKYNRTLLVDTVNNDGFKYNLSYYFESKSDLLKIDYDEVLDILKVLQSSNSVSFPNINYVYHQSHFSHHFNNFISNENNSLLTFDFNTWYHEELLIHDQCGGGSPNMEIFTKLKLKEHMMQNFYEKYGKIAEFCGKNDYSAVHIRNTDMKTDNIDNFIHSIPCKNDAFFISTDDKYSLDIITNNYRAINFSNIENVTCSLHLDSIDSDEKRKRNIDSITDILLLSFSYFLIGSNESSGYFQLAKSLKENWEIRDTLFH